MATPRPLHSDSPAAASSSSNLLLSPPLLHLADPPPHTVDARLVDLLADQLIRSLRDSAQAARDRHARDHRAVEEELDALGLGAPRAGTAAASPRPTGTGTGTGGAGEDDAAVDEAVRSRLDDLGFKVGWATAERLARDRPRFPSLSTSSSSSSPSAPSPSTAASSAPDPLELVKFLCKDVWTALYDKQVDNLRTNHRGVYVLLDQSVRSLRGVSVPEGRDDEREVTRWVAAVLAFPSGIIRGALSNLGVSATVTAESAALPQATFQIKTGRAGGL